MTPYDILGLKPGCNKAEIKKAYRSWIKQWHPDVCHHPSAVQQTALLNAAYEELMTKKPLSPVREDAVYYGFYTSTTTTSTSSFNW